MSKVIISAFPDFKREIDKNKPFLNIAEFFTDTIQGENFVGYPSTFLRLQGCTLKCKFCDSKKVWKFGNPYTIDELFDLMNFNGVIYRLNEDGHLILTGGSPLLQQRNLIIFISEFIKIYKFKPYIEVENECTIFPVREFVQYVDCWNNCPKLLSSGNKKDVRYKPFILRFLSNRRNSWFKFVIQKETDWREIQEDFLNTNLIRKSQIVLMPLGSTREELEKFRLIAVNMAIEHNVRFTDRLHITLWNKLVGV